MAIETINGSDLSGTNGTANRTHTLAVTDFTADTMQVFANGTYLHQGSGKDYTVSSNVITFLNVMFDVQVITIIYDTTTATSTSTLKYSTPLSLTKHLQILGTVPDRENTTREEVGTGNNSVTDFWIDKLGVIEDTYTISYGSVKSSVTDLTETTHYTIDLDTSKVTLTSAGVTAVGTNKVFAAYSYNTLELLNSEMNKALAAAEADVELFTEQRFANYTDTNPAYRKIVDEQLEGHYNPVSKVFEGFFNPWVDLSTTTNGDYTTGGTEITLSDASGFPTSGTIYIGGNKVAYTGKSSNTLTIPSSTPSIDDDSTVVGVVIEMSKEPEGSALSFEVLDPDTEYKIDYLNGHVHPLSNSYWGEIAAEDRLYPSNYVIRISYFSAWHEKNENPIVRDDVEEVVNMLAAKKFTQRIIKKSHIGGLNKFNPSALDSGKEYILKKLEWYKPLNVGGSMHDKQFVSGGDRYGY